MGGESVRLWEYLIHHICIQIITEHSNESRKYTSFLKMGAYVNAVVRLRLQLQIRKNTYCSGPFFLHSTTASELCNICSIQILPALIYIKLLIHSFLGRIFMVQFNIIFCCINSKAHYTYITFHSAATMSADVLILPSRDSIWKQHCTTPSRFIRSRAQCNANPLITQGTAESRPFSKIHLLPTCRNH